MEINAAKIGSSSTGLLYERQSNKGLEKIHHMKLHICNSVL